MTCAHAAPVIRVANERIARVEELWVVVTLDAGDERLCAGMPGAIDGIDVWVDPPKAPPRSWGGSLLECGGVVPTNGETRSVALRHEFRLPGAWFDWPGEYRVWAERACRLGAAPERSAVIIVVVEEPPDHERDAMLLARAGFGLDGQGASRESQDELAARYPDSRYGQVIRLDHALADLKSAHAASDIVGGARITLAELARHAEATGVRVAAARALLEHPDTLPGLQIDSEELQSLVDDYLSNPAQRTDAGAPRDPR